MRRDWAVGVGVLLVAGLLNAACGRDETGSPKSSAEVLLNVSGSYTDTTGTGPSATPVEATASISYEVNESGVSESRAVNLPWSTKVKGPVVLVELVATAKDAKGARIECSIKAGETVLASNVSTGGGSKVACKWKAK